MVGDNNNDSGTPAAAAGARPAGFGSLLRESREVLGMSVSQTAERLYCDPLVVAALENEDVAALGADVYARGHLKRYADFLKLPTAELLGLYDQLGRRPTAIPDLTRIARAERAADPNKYLNWLYVILAGVLGAFIVYAVLQMPRSERNEVAANSSVAVITAPASAPANAMPPDASAVPTASTPSGIATSTAVGADVAASPPASAAPAGTSDGRVRLALRATADCWTEVYDQEGRQLFFNVVKRGSRHAVAAQGPLRLVVGNAKELLLEVAGRELTIPESLQRKGTALITIDAAGRMESGR
jgi:cytoskeleton protein RodZ